jgi:hypothetical protein
MIQNIKESGIVTIGFHSQFILESVLTGIMASQIVDYDFFFHVDQIFRETVSFLISSHLGIEDYVCILIDQRVHQLHEIVKNPPTGGVSAQLYVRPLQ